MRTPHHGVELCVCPEALLDENTATLVQVKPTVLPRQEARLRCLSNLASCESQTVFDKGHGLMEDCDVLVRVFVDPGWQAMHGHPDDDSEQDEGGCEYVHLCLTRDQWTDLQIKVIGMFRIHEMPVSD